MKEGRVSTTECALTDPVGWDHNIKRGAGIHDALEPNSAAMLVHYLFHHRKTESGPFRFTQGHKRLEDPVLDRLGNALPGIVNTKRE